MKTARWSLFTALLPLLWAPLPAPAGLLGASCSVSTTPVNLAYNPFDNSDQAAAGYIQVSCAPAVGVTSVSLAIGVSTGNSAAYSTRKLTSSSSALNYNLYTNSSHTTILGDGTVGTQRISDSFITQLVTVTKNYPFYTLIPRGQNVTPGTYTDTLVVTISY